MNTDINCIQNDTVDAPKVRRANIFRRIQTRFSTSKAAYLSLCFFVPVVITFLSYLAMGLHPFGDGSVLVLDLNAQYVYFFEALRDFVWGEASPLYSFARSLGGEFVGIYSYYVASPLSYIVALFPQDRMLEALLTIILLKSGLSGLTFGFYLHKNSKVQNKLYIIMFSAMYALCSYAVVYQHNVMWMDAFLLLPLLTYGIEQLIKHGKFKLFVASLALTVWSNYYIGYMVCFYVAAYFYYYYTSNKKEDINPTGQRLHFLRSNVRILLFSLLAIAIAAFVVLGAYYSLTFGKDEFSNPNWSFKLNFDILDFFTKFLPGTYDTVRPEGLPLVYTGLLSVILIPVYFMAKKISAREKLLSLGFIIFFVLCFIVNPLDLILHGFQHPNWLNYRYSFTLCFFLVVLAYKGMCCLQQVSEKFLLGVAAILVLFVAFAQKLDFKSYIKSDSKLLAVQTVVLSILLAVAFLVLLCLIRSAKKHSAKEGLCAVLAVVVCAELFCNMLTCFVQFDKDVYYSGYSGYNDFLAENREITDKVKERDDGFYRMELGSHRQTNDNMALAIKGVTGSTSTLNKQTILFLNRLGYASESHWSQYYVGNPVSDALLGIKYVIEPQGVDVPSYYTEIESTEEHVAYVNPYALSFAFSVDGAIKNFKIEDHKTPALALNYMVAAMVGKQNYDIFTPLSVEDEKTVYCETSYIAGHKMYKKSEDAGEAASSVTYKTHAQSEGDVFFCSPSDYTRSTYIYVNGKMVEHRGIAESYRDRMIYLGYFEQGDKIEVKLSLNDTELYLLNDCDYFYTLDRAKLDEAFGVLSAGASFDIDTESSDTNIFGKITTTRDTETVFTSIPYDEGWRVLVDGVEVEDFIIVDALLSFDISGAGEHTLELKYEATPHTAGIYISFFASILFLLLCALELVMKKIVAKKGALVKYMPLNIKESEDALWELDGDDADENTCERSKVMSLLANGAVKLFKKIFRKKKKAEELSDTLPTDEKQEIQEETQKTQNNEDIGGN